MILTAAASHAEDVPAPEVERKNILHIYNWADYMSPDVLEDFARDTGIIVTYDMMDSNELLESRLVAGSTGYDVVFPSASYLGRQIKAGIYRKLDKTQLPNLRNLDPDITEKLGKFDPGNEHSAIYMWGTSGVAYNDAAVRIMMPEAPVNSFAMLYDPKVVSKFAECGVSLLDAPSEVISTVLLYLGKDASSENPQDLAAVEAVLKSIRPYIRLINSSTYIDALARARSVSRSDGRETCCKRVSVPAKLTSPTTSNIACLGGRGDVLRLHGHPRGCQARGERAPLHQLPAPRGSGGGQLWLRRLSQWQPRGAASFSHGIDGRQQLLPHARDAEETRA